MDPLERFRIFFERLSRKAVWRWRRFVCATSLRLISNAKRKRPQSGIPLYADVGAAGGFADEWRWAAEKGLVRLLGFEPNPASFAMLPVVSACQYLPYALSDHDGQEIMHLTRSEGCSSYLMPDFAALRKFAAVEDFEIISEARLPTRAFRSLIESGEAEVPQFLKLDVQGFEYQVLAGFGEYLEKVIAIELESHLTPIYVDQKAIETLVPFLASKGFECRRMEQQGNFDGAALEFNLWFSRRLDLLNTEEKEMLTLWEVICAIPPRYFTNYSRIKESYHAGKPIY